MNAGYHFTHIHISNFHYHCSNDSMISSWFKHYETDVPENRKTLTVAQIKTDYLETWNKDLVLSCFHCLLCNPFK